MLRIGTVPYLVARPLTAGLDRDHRVRLSVAPPALLAEELKAGRLDVALASSILAVEDARLRLWEEGPVIAARRACRSVLLFLRPGLPGPGAVRSLRTDPASRTGAALARVLLRDTFGARFEERRGAAGEDPFAAGADAVQLIGDAALRVAGAPGEWEVVDLGVTWNDLTRLPFVYAGWIGREGFHPAEAGEVLLAAAERGLAARPALVEDGVAATGRGAAFLRRYLCDDMDYRLPAPLVRAALAEFRARLARRFDPAPAGIR